MNKTTLCLAVAAALTHVNAGARKFEFLMK